MLDIIADLIVVELLGKALKKLPGRPVYWIVGLVIFVLVVVAISYKLSGST